MRKTKIICTLGPATDDIQTLRELILGGMNVARFNFSHGDHPSHKKRLDQLIELREKLQLPIATILDTKGPEIRIKTFKNGKIHLNKNDTFTLTTREIVGDETIVSITYKDLPQDVSIGSHILIDDGLVDMTVIDLNPTDITCRVLNDGDISNTKGVNVPNSHLSMPYISKRDYDDIVFGIENGFDFIAASFARSSDDILAIRKILEEHHCKTINIIAKIENKEGVENIDDILRVCEGIMVARGDMGVEIPFEDVPVLQKMMIKKAYNSGKQVITATQMLDSMMKHPRPTRAEATDVANAIYDGTSGIMLSGETAAGMYPVESVKTMARIAVRAENDIDYLKRFNSMDIDPIPYITNAISHATCTTAHDLKAAAIITVTKSGKTARMISRYRPLCPIIGCTTAPNVCRQMNMSWGVIPILIDEKESTDDLFETAVDKAKETGLVSNGDIVVITAGVPLGVSGTTNMMKVDVVGNTLVTGHGSGRHDVTANLCVCKDTTQALENFKDGDILVIGETDNTLMTVLRKASGIIVESLKENNHAVTVGMALDIPVLSACENATKLLHSGSIVTLDPLKGIVSAI